MSYTFPECAAIAGWQNPHGAALPPPNASERSCSITGVPDHEIRRQFDTSVFGLLDVTRRFVPDMIAARRGRIVDIGSVVGTLVTPFGGAWSATKFAVRAPSDAMRLELRPFGIRVIEVRP